MYNKNTAGMSEGSNIFTEKRIEQSIAENIKEEYFSKTEMMEILRPMMDYLEVLSDTYGIELQRGIQFQYRRPVLNEGAE